MAKKLSHNVSCPCGSGKKYKHCCVDRDIDFVDLNDGQIGRTAQLSPETMMLLATLRQSQVELQQE